MHPRQSKGQNVAKALHHRAIKPSRRACNIDEIRTCSYEFAPRAEKLMQIHEKCQGNRVFVRACLRYGSIFHLLRSRKSYNLNNAPIRSRISSRWIVSSDLTYRRLSARSVETSKWIRTFDRTCRHRECNILANNARASLASLVAIAC